MAILTSLAVDDPTPPMQLNPEISTELSDLILKLLEKKPERRPSDARVVAEALLGVLLRVSRPTVEVIPQAEAVDVPQVSDATAIDPWNRIDDSAAAETISPAEPRKPREKPIRNRGERMPIIIGALALVLLVGGAFAIFKVMTKPAPDTGTATFADKEAESRFQTGEVQIGVGDSTQSIRLGDGTLTLSPGRYEVKLIGVDGLELDSPNLTIAAGKEATIRLKAKAIGIAKKDPGGTIIPKALPSESPIRDLKILSPADTVDVQSLTPPEGAKILFDGTEKSFLNWVDRKTSVTNTSWKIVEGGALEIGKGDIVTVEKFEGRFKLHVEFRVPYLPRATGQQRGNSGVYLQGRYELQILDSYGLGSKDNECGGFYSIAKPLVNACKAPTIWQSFDIDFTAPVFKAGKKIEAARVTVFQNGVKIHDDTTLTKDNTISGAGGDPSLPGPILLQEHGSPVQFRNIWLLPLAPDAPLTPEEAKQQQDDEAKKLGVTPQTQNGIGMKLTLIPAGTFQMGSPDNEPGRDKVEGPQRWVKISKPFWMGTTEVTVGQFREFVLATKREMPKGARSEGDLKPNDAIWWENPGWEQTFDHPVTCVSWNDAVAFCDWLSNREKMKYRLPTEAEWEYACRAGTRTRFFFGDDENRFNEHGVRRDNSGGKSQPVGKLKPNTWGLLDILGNAWEWCSDRNDRQGYDPKSLLDPKGPAGGDERTLRGGGWLSGGTNAVDRRSATRWIWNPLAPDLRWNGAGFRVVCEVMK